MRTGHHVCEADRDEISALLKSVSCEPLRLPASYLSLSMTAIRCCGWVNEFAGKGSVKLCRDLRHKWVMHSALKVNISTINLKKKVDIWLIHAFKGIVHPKMFIQHNLLALMSFQTSMTFFLLVSRTLCFEACLSLFCLYSVSQSTVQTNKTKISLVTLNLEHFILRCPCYTLH